MLKFIITYLSIFFIGCSYNTVKTKNYDFIQGDIPIILNVSHDGPKEFNYTSKRKDSTDNFNIKNDMYTRNIAVNIFNKIKKSTGKSPTLLINNIHRKFVDLNREPEEAYESFRAKVIYNRYHTVLQNEIFRQLQIHDKVYLFDIHGFYSKNIDIVISTRNHSTITKKDIEKLFQNDFSFYNNIISKGFEVRLDDPFYGGYIIKNFKNVNVSAIQIEIERKIRTSQKRREEVSNLLANEIIQLLQP